jgi:histone H3/H4
MGDPVVVRSRIKGYAKGMNVAGDFAEALDKEVQDLIAKAAERAKANNRATIKPRDL